MYNTETLISKWQSHLGLEDWILNVKYVETGVLVNEHGDPICMGTEASKGAKSARIVIDYQYHWNDEDGYNNFEASLVHELLHIIAVEQGVDFIKKPMSDDDRVKWSEFEEDFIDRLSFIIIK